MNKLSLSRALPNALSKALGVPECLIRVFASAKEPLKETMGETSGFGSIYSI